MFVDNILKKNNTFKLDFTQNHNAIESNANVILLREKEINLFILVIKKMIIVRTNLKLIP